ncbi:MAG TPA: PASTA domain-containing protein [Gemmatimonadales bacterium]|nr:PASTA domain-containing protein [Gemmatimonadales bacterium]
MRFRRHLPAGVNWSPLSAFLSGVLGRRGLAPGLAVFVAATLLGYGAAAYFLFPAPIFAASQRVPRVIGLSAEEARTMLTAAQLKPEQSEQVRHPTYAPGVVAWQDPPPDVLVPQGTGVTISVSVGPPRIPVPDVSGHDGAVAQLLIEASGLRVGGHDTAQTAAPRGVVVNTRPPAGAALNAGRSVTLVVSGGAPTITVPGVLGLTLELAGTALEQSGLALGTYFWRSASGSRHGAIIEQRPAAGTLAAPGTAVDVILARSTPR